MRSAVICSYKRGVQVPEGGDSRVIHEGVLSTVVTQYNNNNNGNIHMKVELHLAKILDAYLEIQL